MPPNTPAAQVTRLRTPTANNIASELRHHARQTPERIALKFLGDGDTVTYQASYAELDRQVTALAVELLTSTRSGERALLMYENGPAYVMAFFACLYAGIVAVPAYPADAAHQEHRQRLQSMARDAQTALVLTDLAHLPHTAVWLQALQLPRLPRLIATDDLIKTTDTGAEFAPDTDQLTTRQELPGMAHSGLAFLQYTSGSTSTPKGVRVTHANLIANTQAMRDSMGLRDTDVTVSWLPLYHDMGLIGAMLQSLRWGGCLVLMTGAHFQESPARWLKAISRHGGAHSGGPDFAFRMCVERLSDSTLKSLNLSQWRVAFCASEPVRAKTMHSFASRFAAAGFDARALYCCYGLAESTLVITGGLPLTGVRHVDADPVALAGGRLQVSGAADAVRLVSSGLPVRAHEIRIVDPASGKVREDGVIGEVQIAGPSIADGYWNNPEASIAAFPQQEGRRWLRSGDLGFLHQRHLYISGRLKDTIILRGHNIYPQDLEMYLESAVPALRSGRVAAFPVVTDGIEGIGVAAEVARATQRKQMPQDLIDAVRDAVAQAVGQAPDLVMLLHPGTLPRTTSGKLQRSSCLTLQRNPDFIFHALFDARQAPVNAKGAAPASATELALAGLWQTLLGARAFGVEDSFFACGGQSLSANQLLARVRRQFAVALEMQDIFDLPTLGALAARIDTLRAQSGLAQPLAASDEVARMLAEVKEMSEYDLRQVIAADNGK
ncbi:AMP-binding protein [Herbaspirillum rubrisubalbicans]|nr:AMP-binding protein [Herbaspirillum rubrisubalbicans]